MNNTTYSVRIEARKQATREILGRIVSSAGSFTITAFKAPAYCDLLIHEIGEHTADDFDLISSLQASGAVGEVFLTSESSDPQVILSALRAGAREFFPHPIKEQDVVTALARFRKARSNGGGSQHVKRGKIINMLGTKGGIGTTTMAVNLAVAVAGLPGRSSVALVDMNALFGEVPLFLNLKPVLDWSEAARNVSRLDATYLDNVLLKHTSGVHVLAAPQRSVDQLRITPDALEHVFRIMQSMFDYLVFDSGFRIDEFQKSILRMTDRLFLVAGLNLPSLVNLKQMLDLFKGFGFPEPSAIEIIMNRSGQKSGIDFEEVKKAIEGKMYRHIPNDYRNVTSAINRGVPLSIAAPGADVALKVAALAMDVAGDTTLGEGEGESNQRKKKRYLLFG